MVQSKCTHILNFDKCCQFLITTFFKKAEAIYIPHQQWMNAMRKNSVSNNISNFCQSNRQSQDREFEGTEERRGEETEFATADLKV